jgi:hypothetical protein
MVEIAYTHSSNAHTVAGARRAFCYFREGHRIKSLLDVGAGNGNWLLAAQIAGVADVLGVDGVIPPWEELCVAPDLILQVDLRKPLRLGRGFDAVVCLEVAEHLPEASATTLVSSLCAHADLVFFSAAAPGQHGQNHVNCRAPDYWQVYFNACGFVCLDTLRELMWCDELVEPWYRQNVFVAMRDPDRAGAEPRLRYLIHPAMTEYTDFPSSPMARNFIDLERGAGSPLHYIRLFALAAALRLRRITPVNKAIVEAR